MKLESKQICHFHELSSFFSLSLPAVTNEYHPQPQRQRRTLSSARDPVCKFPQNNFDHSFHRSPLTFVLVIFCGGPSTLELADFSSSHRSRGLATASVHLIYDQRQKLLLLLLPPYLPREQTKQSVYYTRPRSTTVSDTLAKIVTTEARLFARRKKRVQRK